MECKRIMQVSMLLLLSAAATVVPAMSAPINFEDQKNYYSPDPHAVTPPTPKVSYTPPAHATPTPSHAGKPPANCGTPPTGSSHHHTPSPSTGGGSHHTPSPSTGGGSHHSPPTSTPTPSTPTVVTPPTTVTPPSTPGITIPSPPFAFDPNSPPFNCTYWKNHPTIVWGLVGWWGTVGNAFGVTGTLPGFGPHLNILEALTNTRTDGLGELCREGTAALLNCMAHTKFPYTTAQVRNSFVAALSSDKAAAAQAHIFKLANEGRT